MKEITLKVSEVTKTALQLSDLISLNEQPFKGQGRRLLFKLQPELNFLKNSSKDDIEAVKDKTISLGEKIVAPKHYPDEYKDTITKLCDGIVVKESQIEKLLTKKSKKNGSAK